MFSGGRNNNNVASNSRRSVITVGLAMESVENQWIVYIACTGPFYKEYANRKYLVWWQQSVLECVSARRSQRATVADKLTSQSMSGIAPLYSDAPIHQTHTGMRIYFIDSWPSCLLLAKVEHPQHM